MKAGMLQSCRLIFDAQFRWKPIMIEEFMPPQILKEFSIWPGDEIFMIGRLVNQAGWQRNTPVVRFGNLSMLPNPHEPISMEPYGEHEAFLVECRSLSGFSGSPVFLTTTQTITPKDGKMPQELKYVSHEQISTKERQLPAQSEGGLKVNVITMQGRWGPWFIGIDRGHIPLWKQVFTVDEQTHRLDQQTETGYRVEHNTGIACVIPSWRIVDVLNKQSLVKQRNRDDDEITSRQSESSIADIEEAEKTKFIQF